VDLGLWIFFVFFFSFFLNTHQPKINPSKIKATHIHLFYLIYKNKQLISYSKFPVKKINLGQNLKLWENRCLIIFPINILKLENFKVLQKFLEFCDKSHIRVDWAPVAHPRTNGHVERANGMILQGLKPRIFDRLNKSSRK
jgi:hypothetical protein